MYVRRCEVCFIEKQRAKVCIVKQQRTKFRLKIRMYIYICTHTHIMFEGGRDRITAAACWNFKRRIDIACSVYRYCFSRQK